MRAYAFGCNRLANETFRFTKSSETREPREWGRKSPRPDVNIPLPPDSLSLSLSSRLSLLLARGPTRSTPPSRSAFANIVARRGCRSFKGNGR